MQQAWTPLACMIPVTQATNDRKLASDARAAPVGRVTGCFRCMQYITSFSKD
jgi:hypothetical protein